MFSSLMPQRKEFYELLAAHSDRVVAGANATLRLVNSLGLGSDGEARRRVRITQRNVGVPVGARATSCRRRTAAPGTE